MLIATWNVNSIRSRLDRLVAWLRARRPDVLCLQELKCTEEAFPLDEIAAAGYHAAVCGQKTYNGVAILSREPLADVRRGLDDGVDDPQARLVAARVGELNVVCAYVPNGNVVGSEAWDYKLRWFARLQQHLSARYKPADPLVLCSDTNVAFDDLDAAHPERWTDTVIAHPLARSAFSALLAWGLVDVFRARNPGGRLYSFWDYRNLDFPMNNGLRLDHILATPPLAARCASAAVDRDERKGQKPSDHAPVMAVFED